MPNQQSRGFIGRGIAICHRFYSSMDFFVGFLHIKNLRAKDAVTAYSQGGIFMTDFSAFCILSLDVYAADGCFENADSGLVMGCLDYAGFFLDAHDLADDSANGGDLVSDR